MLSLPMYFSLYLFFFVQLIFSLKIMEEEKEIVRTAPTTNCEIELCVNVILKPRTSSQDVQKSSIMATTF